jgi:hypothetical protein
MPRKHKFCKTKRRSELSKIAFPPAIWTNQNRKENRTDHGRARLQPCRACSMDRLQPLGYDFSHGAPQANGDTAESRGLAPIPLFWPPKSSSTGRGGLKSPDGYTGPPTRGGDVFRDQCYFRPATTFSGRGQRGAVPGNIASVSPSRPLQAACVRCHARSHSSFAYPSGGDHRTRHGINQGRLFPPARLERTSLAAWFLRSSHSRSRGRPDQARLHPSKSCKGTHG